MGRLLFPALFFIAAWLTFDSLPTRVALWPVGAAAVQYSVVLIGPLLAGIAAWTAQRDSNHPGLDELLSTSPYSRFKRLLIRFGATLIWGAAVYLGMFCAVALYTGLRATGPLRPDILLPILQGLAVLIAEISIGFAAGLYVPKRFAAPLIAVTLYLVGNTYLSGYAPSSLRAVAAAEIWQPSSFYEFPLQLAGGQFLWLSGLTAIAWSVIAISTLKKAPALVLLLLGSLVATAGVLVLRQPDQVQSWTAGTYRPFEPLCQADVGQIPICFHPSYQAVMPEVSTVVQELTSALEGVPGGPVRAEQSEMRLPDGTILMNEALLSPDGVLYFSVENYVRNQKSLTDLRHNIAAALVQDPYNSANEKYFGDLSPSQAVLYSWLTEEEPRLFNESPEAANARRAALARFLALTPEARHAWLVTNYVSVRVDEITLDEMP